MKNQKHHFLILFLTGLLVLSAKAQILQDVLIPDTNNYRIPHVVVLDTFTFVEHKFDNFEEQKKFNETRYFVNNVYPYAIKALKAMSVTDSSLALIEKKRKRKKFIRNEQKWLKGEFKDDLKDFYIEEGRILVKILERKTGMTMFEIIKKYRSGTTAFVWNTVANLSGYSLKEGYDPEKDYLLEIILAGMESDD